MTTALLAELESPAASIPPPRALRVMFITTTLELGVLNAYRLIRAAAGSPAIRPGDLLP